MIHVGEELLTEELSEAWLKHCAVVMQDGIIFSGTILSNIAMSDESPDLDRVNKVLTIACLDKFIHKLPMGIKTKIGVAGIEISGGEKQRLLIARALYKNPEFLILDEATSSLDATNEYNIVHNIADYMKEKTMIIVAHRLSTVKNADRIVFIKDGEISEYGTHEDLIALRGGYYNLVSNQL
jgi:ATP-binding cassette subfamily B protein